MSTTTNMYQGLSGDRNSSRVLKPPGGGSSNIFGASDAPSEQKAQQPRKGGIFDSPEPKPEPPTRTSDTAQNVFGGTEQGANASPKAPEDVADKNEKENQLTAQEEAEANASARVMNVLTGQPLGIEYVPNEGPDMMKNLAPKYNPITGESISTGAQVPSTRVRQPPGGASSKLW